MKILLVSPKIDCFCNNNPISVLDLAAYLRGKGMNADVCWSDNLPHQPYDIVGISCIGAFNGKSIKEIRHIKETYPSSKIVVGGKWSKTITPIEKEEILFMGAEIVTESGEVYFTGSDIDYSIYPSWASDDVKKMCGNDYIMSSRGCPFKCHFCNNSEDGIHYFAPHRTVDIITIMMNAFGSVFFVDDIFILSPEHMASVMEECDKRKIDIRGRNKFFVHVNMVNDKTLSMIEKYRPEHVQIGIESGDDRMLKEMGKNTNKERISIVVKSLSKITKVRGLWLNGFPGETEESLKNSVGLLSSLREFLSDNWFSFYQPVYNTVGYKKCIDEGGEFFHSLSNREIAYIPKGTNREMLLKYDATMRGIK